MDGYVIRTYNQLEILKSVGQSAANIYILYTQSRIFFYAILLINFIMLMKWEKQFRSYLL